jgi:hypothetical protein
MMFWITRMSRPERSLAIHSFMRSADSATNCREAADFDSRRGRRHVALRPPRRTPELARRDVEQHLVHGPCAEPILRQGLLPARQHDFLPSGTARALGARCRSRPTDPPRRRDAPTAS